MAKKTRGEQRFAAITYRQLAKWTGLTLETIRSYGAKGRIPKDDMQATLRWVNGRRERANLPLIGDPNEPIQDIDTPPAPDTPTTETTDQQNTHSEASHSTTSPTASHPASHPASCRCNCCYLNTKAKRA